MEKEAYSPVHIKPQIILLDLPDSACVELQKQGLNIVPGTLGKPYRVPSNSGYIRLASSGRYPYYTEQEIVVVDLESPEAVEEQPDIELPIKSEPQWWARAGSGIINPRSKTMESLRQHSERIFQNGGCFVAFSAPREYIKFHYGSVDYNGLEIIREGVFDSWGLLPEINAIDTKFDIGSEVIPCDTIFELNQLLHQWLGKFEFNCTISLSPYHAEKWEVIATNKYNQPVGLLSTNRGNKGTILLLPQLADKDLFISKLFKDVLPHLCPHLFPSFEGAKWIQRQEYQLPEVLELAQKKELLEKDFLQRRTVLEKEMESTLAKEQWISDLLIETDAALVNSVRKALEVVGFSEVVDVDSERDAKGQLRREDLQVRDGSPILVVDVKGINGYPSDEDCQQAHKHATLCMKTENRTDVQSLTIINHQRKMPPLDRENNMPFRQELLEYSDEIEMGLLTTWDLWRLIRSFRLNNWKLESVKPIFYRKGRIDPIPENYEYAGEIVKVWEEAKTFGIVLELPEINEGELVAIEFPTEIVEFKIESLQVDGVSQKKAIQGANVGIRVSGEFPEIRKGMRVFYT